MYRNALEDTIVAVSTPIGESGIGIVRLSGYKALEIADKMFVSKDGKRPSQYKTYTVHYGYIVDRRDTNESGAKRSLPEGDERVRSEAEPPRRGRTTISSTRSY